MAVIYEEIEAKSLVRKQKMVEDWWWSSMGMNLYRGCEHACNYCDGRSHKYYVHDDFDQTIYVKINAPELLEMELRRMGYRKDGVRDSSLGEFGAQGLDIARRKAGKAKVIVGVAGGVSDAYQPAEKKYELARKVLEVLRDHSMPVFVLTKSDLVLRDLDIIEDINERSYAHVSFTVTTWEEAVMKRFEPRAPSSARRLEALSKIRERGIRGGVMLMPMLPGIGDTEESIREVVSRSKDAGAEFVLYSSMTMRDEQRERMMGIMECDYPPLVELYKDIYKEAHHPKDDYMIDVHLKAHQICRDLSMPERVPRYIPEGAIENNLKVCEVLCNTAYFMQMKNVYYDKVKAYRRAGHSIDGLEEDIQTIHDEDRLLEVPGVGRVISRDVSLILKTGTCPLYEEMKR